MFRRTKKRTRRKPLLKRKLRTLISNKGRDGNRRGKENEEKFVTAYEEARRAGRLPKWLTAVRKATNEEDHRQKTDAVAITDVGPIHIQIKSSERACAKFVETVWGQFNICVVIRDNEPLEKLVNRTLPKIASRRHRRIQDRKHPR